MVQYEITVTGRVQGVGYRYFVQKRANEFDIKGWVKNTSDGGVLVMAQGEEKDAETFMDYLRTGPSLARVKQLVKNKMPDLKNFTDFRIRY